MPDFGFPAQPRYASMSRLINGLRDRSDDARVETVTGRFRDVTATRGGRVNEVLQIEKSIADLNTYSEAIALSEARASVMQTSLGNIIDTAQKTADTGIILQGDQTAVGFEPFSAGVREELSSMVANLNASFSGRSLFAGDDAGAGAVVSADTIMAVSTTFLEGQITAGAGYGALEAEFMNAGATFDTTIYQGGAGNAPLTEIAPGERVDYTVKADNDVVRGLMFNSVVLAAAYDRTNAIPEDQRRSLLERGTTGLRDAIAGMLEVQAQLGTAEARIATVKSRNIAAEASLTLQFNDLAGVDTYESALTLTELENQLETAFQTTARLSNLSLANYL